MIRPIRERLDWLTIAALAWATAVLFLCLVRFLEWTHWHR